MDTIMDLGEAHATPWLEALFVARQMVPALMARLEYSSGAALELHDGSWNLIVASRKPLCFMDDGIVVNLYRPEQRTYRDNPACLLTVLGAYVDDKTSPDKDRDLVDLCRNVLDGTSPTSIRVCACSSSPELEKKSVRAGLVAAGVEYTGDVESYDPFRHLPDTQPPHVVHPSPIDAHASAFSGW